MAFKINPERVINVTCQVTSAAAPVFTLGPLGIPVGIVSAAGLELAMVNTRSEHANVRKNGRFLVWAVRIFVCILEQMAYQAVCLYWVDETAQKRTLPFGLDPMTFAWGIVVFMAILDLGAYLSNSAKAAAVAIEKEYRENIERGDEIEKQRAERMANEAREKREHEARLAQIAADTAKAQAEAAARAQAEAARAQAEAQAEAARAQAEAVRIKAEADRQAAEVAAEAARKRAEADRKRQEDERKREEAARKVAEAAAEARRRQAEEAEARRNAQIVEQQRLAQQKAAQEQREREAAEAANRKREQEEAEARAASDAKRNRFRLASGFERLQMIAETEATLTSALNRRPTQAEIANELGTTDRTLRECLKLHRTAQAA